MKGNFRRASFFIRVEGWNVWETYVEGVDMCKQGKEKYQEGKQNLLKGNKRKLVIKRGEIRYKLMVQNLSRIKLLETHFNL
jgi:hypothetical protein